MLVLKYDTFTFESDLVDFVNRNKIARENIVIITRGTEGLGGVKMAIFYYAEE